MEEIELLCAYLDHPSNVNLKYFYNGGLSIWVHWS